MTVNEIIKPVAPTRTSVDTGCFPAVFARLERIEPSEQPLPAWAREIKKAALARFELSGLPTRRNEEWKYTNVKAIGAEKYILSHEDTATSQLSEELIKFHVPAASAHELSLVFLDGVLATGRSQLTSLPTGLQVMDLTEACQKKPESVRAFLSRKEPQEGNPFAALNTAFLGTGAYIEVERGKKISQVLHLIYLSSKGDRRARPLATFPRNLIVIGEQSELTVVETYAGEGEYFCSPVSDASVAAAGRLLHHRIQADSAKAQHIGVSRVDIARDAHYEAFNFSIGAKLARHDVNIALSGEGSSVVLNGMYLACGAQHVDNHSTIDHKVPHTTSSQHYKGILDEEARGVFNGKVFVRQDAQKANAFQLNRNLLLSSDAEIDTKPELQIDADDVKCSHGAAIGRLDAMEIFYLMSRGIPRLQAESILCQAFANEVVTKITTPSVQSVVKAMVAGYFNL
jgi:Fe-S cluster assembly protein SufD